MAALRGHRTVAHGFANALDIVRVEYDFARDGGGLGSKDVVTANGDVLVVAAWVGIKTACASLGAAAVKVGFTNDDDAIVDATRGRLAKLTTGALIKPRPTINTEVFSFTYADFQAAAITSDVALMSIPAKHVVESVIIKVTTPFEGTTLFGVSVGTTLSPLLYATTGNIADPTAADDSVSANSFNGVPSPTFPLHYTDDTQLYIQGNGVDENLDALSAGALDVYVTTRALPSALADGLVPHLLASGEKVVMNIGGAALTAGKFEIVLVLCRP